MADPYGVAAGFALFSGLALGLLGVGLLALRPRHGYATAFALFLVLWAAHLVAGNLARFSALGGDPAGAERWVVASLPPLLLLYLPLAYFAAIYPPRRGRLAERPAWTAALLAPAAVGTLLFLAAPTLFFQGLTGAGAATRSLWGPLHPLYVAFLFGAFFYAILATERAHREAAEERDARRGLLVMGALGLYVAYWSAESLLAYGALALGSGMGLGEGTVLLLAAAGIALTARAALRAARDARPQAGPLPRLVGGGLVAAAAFGALSGATLAAGFAAPIETLGLWRLLAVGALVIAVLRYDLFQVDLGPLRAELGEARRELRRERVFVERFVESSGDPIVAFDRAGRVTVWNPAMERASRVPKAKAIGATVRDVLPFFGEGEPARLARDALDGASGQGEARPFGTERVYELRVAPLYEAPGEALGALVVLHDVTERRRDEEEHRRSDERLREIERLQEVNKFKTQFINTAAHELNTPLTTMLIQADLLRRGGDDLSPQHRKSVHILDRNARRLGHLVQDILEAARLQAGRLGVKKEAVDLQAVVEDAVESFQEPARRAGLKLRSRSEAGVKVEADPKRVAQVLFNLLGNAVKFTPSGGSVTVEAFRDGREAIVRVRDTGRGVGGQDLARLFQPFSQVHDPVQVTEQGTGLGLYISKGLVEQHGGRIWAESEGRGKGATFAFTLPLREAAEAPPAARRVPPPAA